MTGERERARGTGRGPMAVLPSPRPAVVVAPGPPVPSDREGAERRVPADRRDHSRLVGAVGRPGPLTPDSHGIHVPPPPWGYGPHEA